MTAPAQALRIVVLLYGLILLVGGTIGYTHAGSMASLIAGLLSGFVAIIAATLLEQRHCRPAGTLATIEALILTLFFSYRFGLSGAFMPSGLMALLSLIVLALLLWQRKQWWRKRALRK